MNELMLLFSCTSLRIYSTRTRMKKVMSIVSQLHEQQNIEHSAYDD